MIYKLCRAVILILQLFTIHTDRKQNKSEQALQIIGHVVAELYGNKC
jgi:hypothetical protein